VLVLPLELVDSHLEKADFIRFWCRKFCFVIFSVSYDCYLTFSVRFGDDVHYPSPFSEFVVPMEDLPEIFQAKMSIVESHFILPSEVKKTVVKVDQDYLPFEKRPDGHITTREMRQFKLRLRTQNQNFLETLGFVTVYDLMDKEDGLTASEQ
jgi:hypothetical protein